jgi:hypothetical protein
MLSPEAEVWRQRDTPLKNRGMRIQTVQENQRQEKRPFRTGVGNDLAWEPMKKNMHAPRNRGRSGYMSLNTEVKGVSCP